MTENNIPTIYASIGDRTDPQLSLTDRIQNLIPNHDRECSEAILLLFQQLWQKRLDQLDHKWRTRVEQVPDKLWILKQLEFNKTQDAVELIQNIHSQWVKKILT